MNVSTDPIRLAFDRYLDQVRLDEPAALATAALAGRVRNRMAHHSWPCDSHELLADLKDNPSWYGPPETRAMLEALEPGPGIGGPRMIAFFLFVETLTAIAAVERTSLGTPAARRVRARAASAHANSTWERWLELSWQQHIADDLDTSGPSRTATLNGAVSSPLDRITHQIAALLDADADAGSLPFLLADSRARPRSGQETGQAAQPESTAIATLPRSSRTVIERSKLAAVLGKRYDSGESIRTLAASTGRSYGFVHRILTETGVTLRGRGGATRGRYSGLSPGVVKATSSTGQSALSFWPG
jgi:hypothetical protein